MPIVLDVMALPRGARSRTRQLHDAFFEGYAKTHPDLVRVEVDLASQHAALPAFDEWDIEAKFSMMYGDGELSEEAAERWSQLVALTDQLHTANLVVISTPMWNLSVPWHLKRWIDCVVQARLTFEVRDGAFHGLLGGRPAVILATRDGAYAPGTPFASWDFQVPYLEAVLGMMGLGPIRTVVAEPMMFAGVEAGERALADAVEAARELGAGL
jgi:FMN-dependent NADH-azoreductase